MWWDACNKWLYLGPGKGQNRPFTIMFDNWMLWFSRRPTIRHWVLFDIMWDNGAWWGDLQTKEEITVPRMEGKYIEQEKFTSLSGSLPCFVQITICGIGFRKWYNKDMTVINHLPNKNK